MSADWRQFTPETSSGNQSSVSHILSYHFILFSLTLYICAYPKLCINVEDINEEIV